MLRAQEGEKARAGKITGRIVNETTKEPIPGVNVTVVGTGLGASTDIEGNFAIALVPAGTYAIRAYIVGFSPLVRTDIVVNPVKPAEVNIELKESGVELGAVQISAEYFQKVPDLPLSTQMQTNEEIRRLPGGFEDVIRAISILPGVAQVQPGRNDLIVRGGAPSENLYIVDNIELSNINHFGTQGASGGPLSFINLDFVEGTTFSTGGFGARYGDKLSSVLSINFRDGRRDRIGGKLTLAATQFGANLEGPLSESSSFILSARRSYLDFFFKAAGFSFVPEYWDFFAKADFSVGRNDEIKILGIGALDDVRLFNETDQKRFDNSRILYSNQNQVVGGVSWRHLFSSGYTTVTAGQNFVDYDFRQDDTLLQPVFTNKSFENESSLRGDVLIQLSKTAEVSFGIQGKSVRFYSRMLLRPFSSSFGQQVSVDASYDTLAYKAAAYVQLSQSFDRLRVTAGARADYFNMIEKTSSVAPRLSSSYSLTPLTNINLSLGRYYQAPSYIWLVSNPQNRRLKFVGVNQFVIGVDHMLRPDTKISLEAYLKKYFDYPVSSTQPFVVLANTGAGYGGTNEAFASFGVDPLESSGSGQAHGVELFIQKKLSEIPCYGVFSLSYNQSRFTALDGVSRPSSFDQRWILNLGGGYIFNDRWEISTKFRLATGRPYTPYNSDGSQSVTLFNSQRTGTNHSMDVRADRRWMFDNWSLITYVDIQNIYNHKAEGVSRYNERKQTVEQPEAIGILPSIGISAEF